MALLDNCLASLLSRDKNIIVCAKYLHGFKQEVVCVQGCLVFYFFKLVRFWLIKEQAQ